MCEFEGNLNNEIKLDLFEMDFYIIFPSTETLSVCLVIFVTIAFLLFRKKGNYLPDYNRAVPVIDLIKTLEKLCPINCQNKWNLFPFNDGCYTCWTQSITLPILQKSINLYGSASVVNSSSSNVFSLISDVSKWCDWNPFYSSQYIVKPFHDKQLRRDHHMEAEQIVSIVRTTNTIQSHTIMYRFHKFYENKVGWILYWNPKKLDFLYFLILPIKNGDENPPCLLTHVMGNDSQLAESCVSLVSQRLRNIQYLLTLFSLCIVPSFFMSTDPSSSEDLNSKKKSFSLTPVRTSKKEAKNTVFILVPFVKSLTSYWKRDVEFKLAVKNMDVESSEKILPVFQDTESEDKIEPFPKKPLRRTVSDVSFKSKILSDAWKDSKVTDTSKDNILTINKRENTAPTNNLLKLSKQNSDTTSEDSEAKSSSSSKRKLFSKSKILSRSETAISNVGNCTNKLMTTFRKESERGYKLQNINEDVEDKVIAMHEQDSKEIFNSSISDFEVVECPEYIENQIAGFITQGNYAAAELQAEVLAASQLLLDMDSGNYESVGGWMYHSNHKGMCVLTKTTSSQFLKITSFLCQIEIAVPSKDVWKFVKYPQFRFICDESVKSVEVLEKLSSSQKLIHTYHEINGFLRKELMDFCLLQTEREELNKYYSCFCSVEHDKCPLMKSATRGALRPSGWIVENLDSNPNRSLVTYMIQVLINSQDSLFIQELSNMVPQSVYNLKNYILSKPM